MKVFLVICNDSMSAWDSSFDHFVMGLCSKRLLYVDFLIFGIIFRYYNL